MDIWKWSLATVAVILIVAVIVRWGAKAVFASNRKKYGFDSQGDRLSIKELEERIEQEDTWARSEQTRLEAWLQQLKNPKYEEFTPAKVLAAAEPTEVRTMQEITGEITSDPAALIDRLRSIGSNSLAQVFRWFTRSNPDEVSVSYHVLVQDSCKHLGFKCPLESSLFEAEQLLQRQAFSKVLSSMPASEREKLLAELASKTAAPGLGKEAAVGGGLIVANLSGFGLYLASSTALGAVTSAIGVTLPFAVYTGMSSTLAVLIGPVGWVALGTWVVHKLGKSDPNKVIAGTLLVANIRQRLIAIRDEPIPYIVRDKDHTLASFRRDLAALRSRLRKAERYSQSSMERLAASSYATPNRPVLASDAKRSVEAAPEPHAVLAAPSPLRKV